MRMMRYWLAVFAGMWCGCSQDVHAEYEAAGGHGSGIGWDDFVLFYNKLKARKHGHARRRRKAGGSGGAKVEEDENAVPTADSVETVFNVRRGAYGRARCCGPPARACTMLAVALCTLLTMFAWPHVCHVNVAMVLCQCRCCWRVQQRFCAFGGHKGAGALEMDNAHFAKFAKETGLVHRKGRLTVTDVDLIFSQVKTKGQRKIKYAQFESALELIGACWACEAARCGVTGIAVTP